ncbi:hypothetical protein Ae201684P_016531 [Aphanomyces euteiches]|uniref:HECT-type E3 ubiquitin transferase n=1 Tax=Aphanomyces euteiches TaxID=100861 RepID=A0A6G0WF45_9STRA|nr:hypothetical protein Ae201684_015669 [Aphanomyces euteiches]KAH9093911.1 hypothetical protein Ae201684P_016531 [Aphanomyces euteiches]
MADVNSSSGMSTSPLMIVLVVVGFFVFAIIVVYCNRRSSSESSNEALLAEGMREFMPGLKREDVEELLQDAERWKCTVCAFLNVIDKPICSLCHSMKDVRFVEPTERDVISSKYIDSSQTSMSGQIVSGLRRTKSIGATLVRQASKNRLRRMTSFFQHVLLPEDLNAKQRSARMRKQWTREMQGDQIVWVQHFLDSEDFPAAYTIRLNPGVRSGTILEIVVADKVTQIPTSESLNGRSIAWMPVEHVDGSLSVLNSSIMPSVWQSLIALSKIAFSFKYAWFLHQASSLVTPFEELHVKTRCTRETVYEEAMENLLGLKDRALCSIIRFEFIGEVGLDAGAVQREWYMVVAQALLSESSGLFVVSNRDDNSYFINPNSEHDVQETTLHKQFKLSHLDAFRAVGRFMGRALLDGQVLPLHLNPVLFKAILGVPMTLDDVECLDRSVYKSLRYVVENSGVDSLALTFSETEQRGHFVTEINLIENGQEIEVTDANKYEYVDLKVRYLLFTRIQDQLNALVQGIYDIVPPELLIPFDHKELELVLCGLPEIDVADWEANSVASSNLKDSAVLVWFWEVVGSFTPEEQAKLLQFSTGSSRVPVQGFKGLTSYDGRICYFTLKGLPYVPGTFPTAHACFNRIDLPLYPTRDLLELALRALLLSEATGFNIE